MNKKKLVVLLMIGVLAVAAVVTWTSGVQVTDPETTLPAFLNEVVEPSNVSAGVDLRYTHAGGAFSFSYPEGFTPKLQSDGDDGEVVVLENGEVGVQITIVPFDEKIALSPERIKQDIPDLVMDRTETVSLAGVQAVAFQSTNASTAQSSEVWFVHGGKLYLVSAPHDSEALVSGIIKTWQF